MSTGKLLATTVRIPPELHKKAAEAAAECFIPLNTFILQAMNEKLKRGDWLDHVKDQDDGK